MTLSHGSMSQKQTIDTSAMFQLQPKDMTSGSVGAQRRRWSRVVGSPASRPCDPGGLWRCQELGRRPLLAVAPDVGIDIRVAPLLFQVCCSHPSEGIKRGPAGSMRRYRCSPMSKTCASLKQAISNVDSRPSKQKKKGQLSFNAL